MQGIYGTIFPNSLLTNTKLQDLARPRVKVVRISRRYRGPGSSRASLTTEVGLYRLRECGTAKNKCGLGFGFRV